MGIRTWFPAVVASAAMVFVMPVVVVPSAGAQSAPEDFCDDVVDISLVFNKVEDEPTKKQERQITRLAEDLSESAPAEVAGPVATALDGVRSGNFDDPLVGEAVSTVDGYVADNCGFPVHDVTGREYEFVGVPESVDTGINLFRFTNEGAELHEMVVARIKGDETIEELLQLPEKQVNKKVQFVGGTFAEQEGTGMLYTDLEKPGRYAAVCFIPVGTTDPNVEPPGDTPHAAEGMVAEFEVEG